MDDDERPTQTMSHEVGMSLERLSVEELERRLVLLNDEIGRVRGEIDRKKASKTAADSFFK